MQVKLKVVSGAGAGREVVVSVRQLLIGRGEDCQLRPKSDSVSRRHCVLKVEDSRVTIRDLGSRNGTIVNGETISDERVLAPGDLLRIGKLEFEVLIDYGLGGAKKPKVRDLREAAERTAPRTAIGDEDVTDWLEEGDEEDRARRLADPETRQFRLDDTERVALEAAARRVTEETKADPPADEATSDDTKTDDTKTDKSKRKKKEYGKLPKVEEPMAADTRTAAADTLRKFFNRR